MIYEILNNDGQIINTIVADQDFVDKWYPGVHRLVELESPIEPESIVEPDPPVIAIPEKTEEEKLSDAIAAAVAKLIADGVLQQTLE